MQLRIQNDFASISSSIRATSVRTLPVQKVGGRDGHGDGAFNLDYLLGENFKIVSQF